MTRVSDADYRHYRLLDRLIQAASGDSDPMGLSTQRQARGDRREYRTYGTITITNNTKAMLIDVSAKPPLMVPGNPGTPAEWLLNHDALEVHVFLHGNLIAVLGNGYVTLDMSHGYRTATTRQRMSEIVRANVPGVYFGTENGERGGCNYDTYLSTWTDAPGATHEPDSPGQWLVRHPKAVVTRHKGNTTTTTKLPVMVGYDMSDHSTDDYRVTIPVPRAYGA